MSDYTPGDKVKYIGCTETQIKWGSNTNPNGILNIGDEYYIENVEVHSWHTKLMLRRIEGKFNSVCFELQNNPVNTKMTETYEYNENLAITDEDTHKALVSHFNQIEEFANNKKFEWEDEPIPEEDYAITFDFDEWLENTLSFMKKNYEYFKEEEPENLKENTIGYVNQIKDYIDGFLLLPVVLYNRKVIEVKSYKVVGENFDEIVKFVKELKENNKMVFLYEVSYTPGRTEELVIETGNVKEIYPKTVYFHKVRYGVVNNDNQNS